MPAHGYIKQEVTRERGGDAFPSKRECGGDAFLGVKQERAGKEEHMRALRHEKHSRRTIGRYNAWVAINAASRWVTQKDREKYWADMAHPSKQAYFRRRHEK